ncbi:MAG: flavodoxin family protein [Spirochaetaceae bacterium]|jgi:multimeric flavodoxin WrbA|nr:flavodoxin family protein [Spirochaetaceae bacterium]
MSTDVFVLFGSPRGNGYTARMLECFLSCRSGAGIEGGTSIFDAYKAAIKPCVHCGHCKKTRGCVYDDFVPIERGLESADILIVASPVYALGFPAPLKTVFDRTQQYFEAKFSLGIEKPVKKRKAALLFASYGSTDGSGVTMMEKQLELVFRVMNANLVQTAVSPNTDSGHFDSEAVRAEVERAALNVRRYLDALP